MKYVQIKSLTWWVGFIAILLGIYLSFVDGFQTRLGQTLGEVILGLTGADANPAQYILFGLGLVGLRSKLERLGS